MNGQPRLCCDNQYLGKTIPVHVRILHRFQRTSIMSLQQSRLMPTLLISPVKPSGFGSSAVTADSECVGGIPSPEVRLVSPTSFPADACFHISPSVYHIGKYLIFDSSIDSELVVRPRKAIHVDTEEKYVCKVRAYFASLAHNGMFGTRLYLQNVEMQK